MITVRQDCKRCNAKILFTKINKEKGIYHCTSCDAVSSIYDDAEYKIIGHPLPIPSGMKFSIEENLLLMELPNSKMRVPNFKEPGCLFLVIAGVILYIASSVRITVNGARDYSYQAMAFALFCGILLMLILKINRARNRPMHISIDPNELHFSQSKNGTTISLATYPSYMIDQLSVKHLAMGTKKYYTLQLLTKDHKMYELLRGPEEYLAYFKFIEQNIESYLGIRDRKVSGEA